MLSKSLRTAFLDIPEAKLEGFSMAKLGVSISSVSAKGLKPVITSAAFLWNLPGFETINVFLLLPALSSESGV